MLIYKLIYTCIRSNHRFAKGLKTELFNPLKNKVKQLKKFSNIGVQITIHLVGLCSRGEGKRKGGEGWGSLLCLHPDLEGKKSRAAFMEFPSSPLPQNFDVVELVSTFG